MRKIGFIGVYDKTDLILNIAKILTTLKYRVLFVDSTINQKAKYIVPVINPTVSYITSFEDIDIAVGFSNMEEIKKYLGSTHEFQYDIVLVDGDSPERIDGFQLDAADKNYFVTSFDMYSLKKGMEVLSNLFSPMHLTKVLFAKDILKEDDEYLNYISGDYKVMWEEDRIYFPIENGDLSVLYENQRVEKIKFKKLSVQYKDSLSFITQQILEENSDNNVRRAIKIIERGV